MPDFAVEKQASLAQGNTCTTCNTHAHERGFVNLLVDHHPHGRLYMCAGCVDAAARLVGCADPAQVAELAENTEALIVAHRELQGELEEARAGMSVPLAEVIDFVAEREKRRPAADTPGDPPEPAPEDGPSPKSRRSKVSA